MTCKLVFENFTFDYMACNNCMTLVYLLWMYLVIALFIFWVSFAS
jgi:hypothetical protein